MKVKLLVEMQQPKSKHHSVTCNTCTHFKARMCILCFFVHCEFCTPGAHRAFGAFRLVNPVLVTELVKRERNRQHGHQSRLLKQTMVRCSAARGEPHLFRAARAPPRLPLRAPADSVATPPRPQAHSRTERV